MRNAPRLSKFMSIITVSWRAILQRYIYIFFFLNSARYTHAHRVREIHSGGEWPASIRLCIIPTARKTYRCMPSAFSTNYLHISTRVCFEVIQACRGVKFLFTFFRPRNDTRANRNRFQFDSRFRTNMGACVNWHQSENIIVSFVTQLYVPAEYWIKKPLI